MRAVPFGKPMISNKERAAVADVLKGNILVHGPKAKEFETAFAVFTSAPYAVSVSSCTAALHLSYFYLGLGPGDEVIMPAQTHCATAHAVELCGAKPVFIDAEKETGNINLDHVEKSITAQTKALSIVHFLGMPVNMDRVTAIAKKRGLFVVEDCALSIGAYFKGIHTGLHGDVGCFSFYPVKHMTTSEGGMLITRDGGIAGKITRQRAFGVDRHTGERAVPGIYDVTMLGFNYRMSELEAAIGIEQVKRLPDFLRKRKINYETLSAGLEDIEGIKQFRSSHDEYQSSYYCLSVLLNTQLAKKRFEIVARLKDKGIGTSVYYPRPVPLFSYYQKKYGYSAGDFPVASRISESSISLPVGPHLRMEDMKYIVRCMKESIKKAR